MNANPFATMAAGVVIGSLLTVGIVYAMAPSVSRRLVERALNKEGIPAAVSRTAGILVEREVSTALSW